MGGRGRGKQKKKKDLLFKLPISQNSECKNVFHKSHCKALKYVTACQTAEYKLQESFTSHLKYIAARPIWQGQRFVSSVIVEVLQQDYTAVSVNES